MAGGVKLKCDAVAFLDPLTINGIGFPKPASPIFCIVAVLAFSMLPLSWLHRLSIRLGMNFGVLIPSYQRIHELASQQGIESEKQRIVDPKKVDILGPQPNTNKPSTIRW